MALQTSGALTWAQIQAEFGGSNPIGINEYYGAGQGTIQSSGALSASHFHGKANNSYLSLGAFSHSPHPRSISGSYGNKYLRNNPVAHNHTVGSVNLPSARKLVNLYVRGNGADNVGDYFDRIYFGGVKVWDSTQYDVSTSGDGTSFSVGAGYNFNAGTHAIRIDTYSAHETTDKLYIASMKFRFVNQ